MMNSAKSRVRILIAFCLVGLGAIATITFSTGTDKNDPKSVAESVKIVSSLPRAQVPTSAPTTLSEPSPVRRRTLALLAEMNRAENLRAFVQKAKYQPELGGFYYATQVANRCWAAKEILRKPPVRLPQEPADLTLRKSVARDRLKALCGDFLDSELSIEESTRLLKSDRSSLDPLVSISNALQKNNNAYDVNYIDALRSLLEESNPLAFVDQNFGLTKEGYYFQDEVFTFGMHGTAGIYAAAKGLAACDMGDTCDQSDYRLLIPCIEKSVCVDSRLELVKALLARNSANPPEALRRIMDLQARMTTAVRTMDIRSFQPPQ